MVAAEPLERRRPGMKSQRMKVERSGTKSELVGGLERKAEEKRRASVAAAAAGKYWKDAMEDDLLVLREPVMVALLVV